MGRHYVTFGWSHTHRANGKTFDCDCVAVIEAETFEEGRKLLKLLDLYLQQVIKIPNGKKDMKYFPRGYLEL
jgi:hypothetical protein